MNDAREEHPLMNGPRMCDPWGSFPFRIRRESKNRSSNGVGEPIGVAPLGAPDAVTTVTVGGGEGVNTQVTGLGSVTTYSNPLQTGQFTGFGLGDYLAYAASQLCKAAGYTK
jgi:hypothetical protein